MKLYNYKYSTGASGENGLLKNRDPFSAIAPWQFHRLGEADTRTGDDLHLALAGEQLERRLGLAPGRYGPE